MPDATPSHTAFLGHRLLASGTLQEVALALQRCLAGDPNAMPLVFSDATGKQVDLDLRGTASEVAARYAPPPASPAPEPEPAAPRGRGRPRLGVVAREVTLLPEHWDWLATQPGGASVALRKLVHQARRAAAASAGTAQARERTYAFMSALGGNLPGFEEAARALFAGDPQKLAAVIARWPPDVREHVLRLATPEPAPS
jgi:hypothetical protein